MATFKPPYNTLLNRSHPLARGLVGAWLMNEWSGEKVWDFSGGNNYATLEQAPSWEGGGLKFDSDYERIDTQKDINSFLSGVGSVSFQYRYTGPSPSYIYFFTAGSGYTTFSLLCENDGDVFDYYIGGELWPRPNIPEAIDGDLHSFVACWDETTNFRQLWFDGEVVSTDTSSAFSWPSASEDTLSIGGRSGAAGRFAAGIIPNYYAYNRVLSAAEIKSLHADPYQMFGSSLVQPWLYVDEEGNVWEKTAADGLYVSESKNTTLVAVPEAIEGVTFSETPFRTIDIDQQVSDGVSSGDSPTGQGTFPKTGSDGISMSELIESFVGIGATGIDGVALAESLTNIATLSASSTDGLNFSDLTDVIATLFVNVQDGESISDSSAGGMLFEKAISAGLSLSDVALQFLELYLISQDGVAYSDSSSIGFSPVYDVTVSESVSMSDVLTLIGNFGVVVTDRFTQGDLATYFLPGGGVQLRITTNEKTYIFNVRAKSFDKTANTKDFGSAAKKDSKKFSL